MVSFCLDSAYYLGEQFSACYSEAKWDKLHIPRAAWFMNLVIVFLNKARQSLLFMIMRHSESGESDLSNYIHQAFAKDGSSFSNLVTLHFKKQHI